RRMDRRGWSQPVQSGITRARSWRTGPDPSSRRRLASRLDVRRRDHRDRAIRRSVDHPLRSGCLAGDLGIGRHRCPAGGDPVRAGARRPPLGPGPLSPAGPLVSRRREALCVLFALLLLAVVVFTALFLFKLPNVSRLFLILLFPSQAILTIA